MPDKLFKSEDERAALKVLYLGGRRFSVGKRLRGLRSIYQKRETGLDYQEHSMQGSHVPGQPPWARVTSLIGWGIAFQGRGRTAGNSGGWPGKMNDREG